MKAKHDGSWTQQRRVIIGGGLAVLISLLLGACALTRQAASIPILWNEFYAQPWVYVKWPTVAMVLPPTMEDRYYPTFSLKKRGGDLIVTGRYMFYETYPQIRHDLRKLGFKPRDLGKMKCYWADPDGKLREMERLNGDEHPEDTAKAGGRKPEKPDVLREIQRRAGIVRFAAD